VTWEVRQAPNDPNAWDVYDGEGKVAHLPWCSKANAHLIAAAPELLAVLKLVDEEAAQDTPEMWAEVYRVIAKAEGR